jgi:hypothetical protein
MLPASPLQLVSDCVRCKVIHIPRAAHWLRLTRQCMLRLLHLRFLALPGASSFFR